MELCQVCILRDITVHEGCQQRYSPLADVRYSGDILYAPQLVFLLNLMMRSLHLSAAD